MERPNKREIDFVKDDTALKEVKGGRTTICKKIICCVNNPKLKMGISIPCIKK